MSKFKFRKVKSILLNISIRFIDLSRSLLKVEIVKTCNGVQWTLATAVPLFRTYLEAKFVYLICKLIEYLLCDLNSINDKFEKINLLRVYEEIEKRM